MTVKLNKKAYEHAKALVREGKVVRDSRDDWSEHAPNNQELSDFLDSKGPGEYTVWFLGVDDEHPDESKAHYKFPYGDFEQVHRCGTLAAESRAGQRKYYDIELATAHLHGMMEGWRAASRTRT